MKMNFSAELAPIWLGEPTQPTIDSQLDWLFNREPFFRLQYGDVGQPLTEWMESELEKTIDLFSLDVGARQAVGASLWLKSFTAHLISGLAALRLKFNRVPLVSIEQISLDVAENGKLKRVGIASNCPFLCLVDDPLAHEPSATVVESEQALDQHLSGLIIEVGQYLAPRFKQQKVNTPQFWGAVGYAAGLVFQKLTQHGCDRALIEQLQPKADQWLAGLLPNFSELNRVKAASQGEVSIYYIRRETCCLKYKLDGKKHCATCQQREPEAQLALYQSKVPTH
ncbi:(2Fe-2S)-binding protein (plasmid) [Photobacterium sp. DA100]|uniref:(2Fe-2S)-binding protein n=1 Tax=Photobacterium sp. DA100 TaxID=3027472 RepID=UPI0024793141|nr:(2Fe-2S)-binding protein [Photobacterium sp. DA100]WEM45410.1 (2Fe-2S)-binding protein [Photobacterium sp. DA100]